MSPVACAPNTVTPMLLLQGMDDERCPRGQAEQLFTALTATDAAPAELVLYPRGGHHFFEDGRPSYRIDAAARTVDWLTKWLALEPPHR
ncbi:alpha/beta hydrolase family protein [Ralstonia mannitolilytica]|uniref:alpha/beta hydrolase family protein n=1 Tax=Ralstonia mannitolilytica TaxID=105219 RepID=UPI0021BBCEA3|nr:prolyl oligopeptidase family serine peptidase [Ralstonia mannitolilytica]